MYFKLLQLCKRKKTIKGVNLVIKLATQHSEDFKCFRGLVLWINIRPQFKHCSSNVDAKTVLMTILQAFI